MILLIHSGKGMLLGMIIANVLGPLSIHYFRKRREQSRLQAAVALALAETVEHQPVPQVHSMADELRVLSRDVMQQEKAARRACREAAERIDQATERCRNLPVTASGPDLGVDALPRPAGPALAEGRDLPRV